MKKKRFLAAILLAVVFCFVVSGMGYGEIIEKEHLLGTKARQLDVELLLSTIDYIMFFPDSFLRVSYHYDEAGWIAEDEKFPVGVSTKGKIYVAVIDSRGVFSGKTGVVLLLEFEAQFLLVSYFVMFLVSDLENDIVVKFMDDVGKPLGYFYQGEYHLWED